MSFNIQDKVEKFARYQHDFWDVLEYLTGPVEDYLKFLLKCVAHDSWTALNGLSRKGLSFDEVLVQKIEKFVRICDKRVLRRLRLTSGQAVIYKLPELLVDKLFFIVDDVSRTSWLEANWKYEGHLERIQKSRERKRRRIKVSDDEQPVPAKKSRYQKEKVKENKVNLRDVYGPTDFTVFVGRKKFNVHKHVLVGHSSVFAAMLGHDMFESRSGTLKIEEFNQQEIREFLRFLYTRSIKHEALAMELFKISGKYDVQELKDEAEKILVRTVSQSNALEVLALGNLYSSTVLKRSAFRELRKEFSKKLNTNLINQPELLEELIQAKETYNEKLLETKLEFQAVWNRIND